MVVLTKERSKCEPHRKIIVSRDEGNPREHRAINEGGHYKVRQYKLDKDIFPNTKCCDYLVLNDSPGNLKAFYIELKGCNIDDAIPQLENARTLTKAELPQYSDFYRIICSKIPTHKINSSKMLKFKNRVGANKVLVKEQTYSENI